MFLPFSQTLLQCVVIIATRILIFDDRGNVCATFDSQWSKLGKHGLCLREIRGRGGKGPISILKINIDVDTVQRKLSISVFFGNSKNLVLCIVTVTCIFRFCFVLDLRPSQRWKTYTLDDVLKCNEASDVAVRSLMCRDEWHLEHHRPLSRSIEVTRTVSQYESSGCCFFQNQYRFESSCRWMLQL